MAITKVTTYPHMEVDLQSGFIHLHTVITVDDPEDNELPLEHRTVLSKYCHDDMTGLPAQVAGIAQTMQSHHDADAGTPTPPAPEPEPEPEAE